MYKAAQAAERAAYQQYQMAVDGAQSEDRAAARSLVDAARSTVDEVSALLVDSRLTAPEDGQIATIFPKRGELVAPGTPIMSLVVMSDAHVVLNIREDLMQQRQLQPPGQACNLRDNGFNVIVGQRQGKTYEKAVADGWVPGETLFSIEDACQKGTIVMCLLSANVSIMLPQQLRLCL